MILKLSPNIFLSTGVAIVKIVKVKIKRNPNKENVSTSSFELNILL